MPKDRSRQETKRLQEYLGNFDKYAKECIKIITKEAKRLPLEMNYPQRLVHERISQQYRETGRVRVIVLKARQEGISTLTSARFFRRAQLVPFTNVLVVADILERSRILFKMYERYDRNLPDWM